MFNKYEIPVINYHSINNNPKANPLGIVSFTIDEFVGHLLYLQNAGYEMISLVELMQRALSGNIGKSLVAVLTFDDGFLDNYLNVQKILEKFKARGTIFVNPGHATEGRVRTIDEHPNAWGFLNFEEMRALDKRGILDVQSHTMTHDFSFVSDQLIDLYTPEQFSQYYWLVWKLCPSTITEWHGDVSRFARHVPSGYPIFQRGRCLQGKQFMPSQEFIDLCIKRFRVDGKKSIAELRSHPEKGGTESEQNYLARIDYQLRESKSVLEHQLSKTIDYICFPGNIYTEHLLSCATSIGYKVYMRHPREQGSNNLTALCSASATLLRNQMVGLRRFGVFSDYPKSFLDKTMARWAIKIALGAFIDDPLYSLCLSAGRFAKKKSNDFSKLMNDLRANLRSP
jgi:hypothetical protein